MDDNKPRRAETMAQLQRQIDALMKLCGEQLKKIDRLQLENARLRRLLAGRGDGEPGEG